MLVVNVINDQNINICHLVSPVQENEMGTIHNLELAGYIFYFHRIFVIKKSIVIFLIY